MLRKKLQTKYILTITTNLTRKQRTEKMEIELYVNNKNLELYYHRDKNNFDIHSTRKSSNDDHSRIFISLLYRPFSLTTTTCTSPRWSPLTSHSSWNAIRAFRLRRRSVRSTPTTSQCKGRKGEMTNDHTESRESKVVTRKSTSKRHATSVTGEHGIDLPRDNYPVYRVFGKRPQRRYGVLHDLLPHPSPLLPFHAALK